MEYKHLLTSDLSELLDQEGFSDRWNFLNHQGRRLNKNDSGWELPEEFIYDNFKLFIYFSIADRFNIRGKIPLIKLMRAVFRLGLKVSKYGTEFLGEDGYINGSKEGSVVFQIAPNNHERGIIGEGISEKAIRYCKVFETLYPEIMDEYMFETAKALLESYDTYEFKTYGRISGYENILRRMFPEDWTQK